MKVSSLRHPDYRTNIALWAKYRLTYKGGWKFIDKYLQKFSTRETSEEFLSRKRITYVPAHAKAVLQQIINAIFQRMTDISRSGGPPSYISAITGEKGGVDLEGNGINGFMGMKVLPELLALGKVGIFIDKKGISQPLSLRDSQSIRPYLYIYEAENICSWKYNSEKELTSVLLKDYNYIFDPITKLPLDTIEEYRLLTKTEEGVLVIFYDSDGKEISKTILELEKIPFVISEISQSLLCDIADIQIGMMNLASSDMNYGLKSNFPFYTEQYNPGADLYLRQATDPDRVNDSTSEGTSAKAEASGQSIVTTGVTQGRRYPKGLDRPEFINPSPDPLKVSMEKQQKMKEEIRELVGIALASLQSRRASAESKQEDSKGKEEGLSQIGLELEATERQIAELWAMFEGIPNTAIINYPENYSLRTDFDRRQEAIELTGQAQKIQSTTYQREIAKEVINLTLGSKVSSDILHKMYGEIEKGTLIFIDPDNIRADHESGLVSDQTASTLRGYPENEVDQAKKDHVEKLARIAAAQSDMSGRGVKPLETDSDKSKKEKLGKPVRGEGKKVE